MAIYTNLPIYKDTYSLLLKISAIMTLLPRDSRYTIGQELRKSVMQILILIYRANRIRQKIIHIQQMKEILLEAQVYIRLLSDMKHISEKKYVELIEITTSIAKQMNNWEKSETRKNDLQAD